MVNIPEKYITRVGKNGRPLKHPRADWIAHPKAFGIPKPKTELRFHPVRKWRFDYAWPEQKVALEIQGGGGGYGRHSRPGGMRADHNKINTAQLMGWIVIQVVRGEECRLSTVEAIAMALDLRKKKPEDEAHSSSAHND